MRVLRVLLLVSAMAGMSAVQLNAGKPRAQVILCPARAVCPDHGTLSNFSGQTKYVGGCVFGLYGHTYVNDPRHPETVHQHTFWESCGCK